MLRDEVKVKLDIWRGLWGTNGLKAAPALVFQIGELLETCVYFAQSP
jgi:hypothetical protein